MWWIGFRQVRLKSDDGIINSPGAAILCGPYQSLGEAQRERMRGLATEWDAAYSVPFQANTIREANVLIEENTPIE